MNVEAGFRSILKHPVILILPIILQVLISFGMGFISFLGIGLYSFGSLHLGASPAEFNIQFTLPIFIPLISDLNQSLSFLPIHEGGSIAWMIVIAVVYFAAVSFTIGMYLGSMKKALVLGNWNNYSIFRLGCRYFWRIFLFQLLSTILTFVSFYLLVTTVIGGIIGFIILFLYLLTPYIVVLEDKRLGEALLDSPKYWKRYVKKFIPLALGTILSILLLSLIIQLLKMDPLQYYIGLISYTFIGSGFIAGFMNLLNTCIHEDEINSAQETEINYSKWKKWTIVVIVLVVPWIGVQFAYGKHVTSLPFQEKTTLTNGIYYMANWSDAHAGSDRTYTTYGFEQRDVLELTLSLPDSESTEDALYGKGEVTWKVDKEVITKQGNSTIYSGEEVVETSEFIYRLTPVYKNGNLYYTSNTEDGFAELTTKGQTDEPMGIELFVMNDGSDVFVYQYKERFDPEPVIQISNDGKYFTPHVSSVNPEDFKYFWYSNEPITKERIVDLMKAKNSTNLTTSGGPHYYHFENLAVAFLQQTDGEALIRLGDHYEQLDIQTNISSKTAEQWTKELEALYGDMNLAEFLEHFNRQNDYDGYKFIGWENDVERDEYQVIVPFPKGDIILHCVREGGLIELNIEMPE
ncbi:hypothetical protein [Ornithinibacillus californiensis]|uniref:hypothetical protein n=1 Tax=Ornithinibacillus californiensis TaxID=161536 RepID=UPI00064DBC5E|nr:hypothetical protein [Ornithinibacillus californiensis]